MYVYRFIIIYNEKSFKTGSRRQPENKFKINFPSIKTNVYGEPCIVVDSKYRSDLS